MECARLHLAADDAVRHAAPLAGVAAVAVLAAVELPGGRGAALGVAVRPGPGQGPHPPVAPHQRAAGRPQSSPSQVLSVTATDISVYCLLSPIRSYSAATGSSEDRPLYQSYCLGLDRVGLEEEEAWQLSDQAEEEGGELDRSQSAPTVRRPGSQHKYTRPKSCLPLLCN